MKKLLCMVLAVIMALMCTVPAFAQDNLCDCGNTPVVIVGGVGCCPFFINEGTPQERVCFPPSVDIGKIIWTVVVGGITAIVKRDFSIFADSVAEVVLGIFEEFSCDENGNSKYAVTAQTFSMSMAETDVYLTNGSPELQMAKMLVDEIGADHTYYYNYDWRLDPVENAAQLNEFIGNVINETHHRKVSLVPCSMGGVQTLTYFAEYGWADIEKAVFMSSADSGLLFVGNLFSGEIEIRQYDAFQYLKTLKTGNDAIDGIIGGMCDMFGAGFVFRLLFGGVNTLADKLNPTLIEKVIKKTFARMPGMWAFVPPEYYPAARELLLSDASQEFLDKIDYYQENVRSKRDAILKNAAKKVSIVFCSHYDNGSVPVSSSGDCHGDNLIETVCTSGGAYCARVGETLPRDYVQKNACCGKNHISTDRIIDASTCTFPDSTWFFKGVNHVGCYYGSEQQDFLLWVLKYKGQPTVFVNNDYPQFMQADHTMMKLTEVE